MKVLCALDGSKHSRWVVEALQRWNFPQGSSLLLLHVVDTAQFRLPKTVGGAAQGAMTRARTMAGKIGRGLLERMKRTLQSVWSVVENQIVRGHPAEMIVRAAARQKADLIVMGSRGLTDVRAFLLGSVSRKVVMHADCPVLLIKKRVPVLRRIVVGMDGSKHAWAGVEYLLRMPLPEVACITVASVVPPLPIETSPIQVSLSEFLEQLHVPLLKKAQTVAKEAVARIQKAGFEAKAVVVHGNPSHEIVKAAEAERADLVVVGSRGLTGTIRFLMGSVSDGVMKYAPCAVLVFRQPMPRGEMLGR
jgi:nucleotide-binding universal stress UspA family protein